MDLWCLERLPSFPTVRRDDALLKPIRLPNCTHRFTVNGLNLERFLNTMQKEEIPLLYALRSSLHAMSCLCYSADLPAVCAIAKEKGWRIEEICPQGFSSVWAWLRRRPGVPAGAAIALVLIFLLSGMIWKVEIDGAGAYQAEIASYLAETGCVAGTARSSIDVKELERKLTYRYPDIAWFHVYVSGMTLVVNASSGVPMPALPASQPGDVVAQQGGIVESIRVYAGTALVRAGDVVQAGQVLIEGTERSADQQVVPVRAQGVVMARCWQAYTVEMPLYEVESTETGNETEQLCIRTPFGTWPAIRTPEYLAYNTYIEMLPLGGAFAPAAAQRVIMREVSMQYRSRNAEDVRKEAGEAALKHLKNSLNGDEIIDKWVDYCMIENETLALSATAEWLMDISGGSPP